MLTGTTQIFGIMQNLLSVKRGETQEKTAQNDPATTTRGDQVSFSPAALRMQEFLGSEQAGNQESEMDFSEVQSLKQRGEMLANLLHMKINNFQGDFLDQVKSAGIEAEMPIDLQKGIDGRLQVAGDHSLKGVLDSFLQGEDALLRQFEEISNLAGVAQMLQNLDPERQGAASGSIASLYARQSQGNESTKPSQDSRLQLRVAETGPSFTFE